MHRRGRRERRGRKRLHIHLCALCVLCGELSLSGCMSLEEMAPPVAALGGGGGQSPESLSRGRHTYLTACAKCHTVEPIGRYSLDKWEEILPEMSEESKLTAAEESDLRA